MSNSDPESYGSREDTDENYYGPRKFIFQVPENHQQSQKETTKDTKALKRSLEAEKQMPFIFNFPEPKNYKESYSQLVKQILGIYNNIRLLVVEEHFNELKHITKDCKIEQPGDCLALLKEILIGCCEKLQTKEKNGREAENNVGMSDYEELLQKAEAKIRVFIRNEQIFRLNFDVLTQKCEDSDKFQQEAQEEIENLRRSQDTLTKESQAIAAKLRTKDDELKKLNKEYETLQKNYKAMQANLSALENMESAPSLNDSNKTPAPSWNQQLLHMLLNENKFTPTETSTRGINLDSKSPWGRLKQQSVHGIPQAGAFKNERKQTAPVHNSSLLNTSTNSMKKGKSDKLTNSIIAEQQKKKLPSNRDILNASLDVVLNKSQEVHHERLSHNGAQNPQMKSTQGMKTGNSQDQMRVKPPIKERKFGETNEKSIPLHFLYKTSLANKSVVAQTKYTNASTRPSSTGKSRGSPMIQRNRVVQTEMSPEPKERSQESGIYHTYSSNFGIDKYSGSYAGMSKKKNSESKERENKDVKVDKSGDKSSIMIQKMIAEQLNKKIGGKKTL